MKLKDFYKQMLNDLDRLEKGEIKAIIAKQRFNQEDIEDIK